MKGNSFHIGLLTAALAGAPLRAGDSVISLDVTAVGRLFGAARGHDARPWWATDVLGGLFGADTGAAKAVRHDFGPDPRRPEFAFFALDTTAGSGDSARYLRRAAVALELGTPPSPRVLVTFDFVVSGGTSPRERWALHTMDEPEVQGTTFVVGGASRIIGTLVMTEAGRLAGSPSAQVSRVKEQDGWRIEIAAEQASQTSAFLNVIRLGKEVGGLGEVSSAELAGVRVANRVVLFYAGLRSTASAMSFEVSGSRTLKYLIAGLAPGTWEIWHNGFLRDPQGGVSRTSGVLYFEGPPGGYFLRRLN